MLVLKLKQETFRLTGFPLALQLLAFRAIPMLQSKIHAPSNEQTIMDLTDPNHPSIELDSVLPVEDNPTLLVTPLIPVLRGPQPGWGLWSNEKTYDNLTYMEQLIANNHRFSKTMWPRGDCWEPVFTFTPTPEEPVHKKHTVLRKRKESKLKPHKVAKEKAVDTEQRRITRLQAASTHNIQFPKSVTNLYMDATSKQQPNYKHIIHILAYINPKYSTSSYQLHKKSLDMKKDNSQTFSQKTSHVRTRPDSTLARTS
ncbi:hypothetical protein F2Q69_00037334 [Brassica cretica]|uniref:Uncharacterized protein n=1 Tax=Brassica cretica TaxID=69181 RepID=A0A8S9SHS8_BRACR|nr:hypothetical protein F2Q69_00037334 [Brassica cretica]